MGKFFFLSKAAIFICLVTIAHFFIFDLKHSEKFQPSDKLPNETLVVLPWAPNSNISTNSEGYTLHHRIVS